MKEDIVQVFSEIVEHSEKTEKPIERKMFFEIRVGEKFWDLESSTTLDLFNYDSFWRKFPPQFLSDSWTKMICEMLKSI